jgi:hypothetical protein
MRAEFELKDADAAIATMTDHPVLIHVPVGTGAIGKEPATGVLSRGVHPSGAPRHIARALESERDQGPRRRRAHPPGHARHPDRLAGPRHRADRPSGRRSARRGHQSTYASVTRASGGITPDEAKTRSCTPRSARARTCDLGAEADLRLDPPRHGRAMPHVFEDLRNSSSSSSA